MLKFGFLGGPFGYPKLSPEIFNIFNIFNISGEMLKFWFFKVEHL